MYYHAKINIHVLATAVGFIWTTYLLLVAPATDTILFQWLTPWFSKSFKIKSAFKSTVITAIGPSSTKQFPGNIWFKTKFTSLVQIYSILNKPISFFNPTTNCNKLIHLNSDLKRSASKQQDNSCLHTCHISITTWLHKTLTKVLVLSLVCYDWVSFQAAMCRILM